MSAAKPTFYLLPVFIWLAITSPTMADVCADFNDCGYMYRCCIDSYSHMPACCYNIAGGWWFWCIWGVVFLVILLTCFAIIRRRQMLRRQREGLIVQQQKAPKAACGILPCTSVRQCPPPGSVPQYQKPEEGPSVQPVSPQAEPLPYKLGEQQQPIPTDGLPPPYKP